VANCALNKGCASAGDCESNQCNAVEHICTEGPCADGIKNNQETDIDCGGGGNCAKCGLHGDCQLPTDCESDHCDAQNLCELHPLEWNFIPQRLCSRVSGSAAALGERIFIAGGRASCAGATVNDHYNIVETLDVDPPPGSWVEDPVLMIYDRPGAQTVASGQNLFVIGGVQDSFTSCFATVSGSDGTAAFTSLADMASSRAYFAATTLSDGRIFVAGGTTGDLADPTNALSSTELYTPDPTLATPGTWEAGAPLGVYRVGAGMVQARDGRIFVMGGQLKYNGGPLVDTVEIYASPASPPTAGSPMPAARSFFGSVRGGRTHLCCRRNHFRRRLPGGPGLRPRVRRVDSASGSPGGSNASGRGHGIGFSALCHRRFRRRLAEGGLRVRTVTHAHARQRGARSNGCAFRIVAPAGHGLLGLCGLDRFTARGHRHYRSDRLPASRIFHHRAHGFVVRAAHDHRDGLEEPVSRAGGALGPVRTRRVPHANSPCAGSRHGPSMTATLRGSRLAVKRFETRGCRSSVNTSIGGVAEARARPFLLTAVTVGLSQRWLT
jgi:hypothetical protein